MKKANSMEMLDVTPKNARAEALEAGEIRHGTTLVVVPTYCEADNVEPLVHGILEALPRGTVIVVDDRSPDGTVAVVRELQKRYGSRLLLLERPGKLGVGSALKEGLLYAVRQGFEFVVQMDADLSHDPAFLPALIEAVSDVDVVIGSRLLGASKVDGRAAFRTALTRTASAVGRRCFGLATTDVSSGFKCWRTASFRRLDLTRIVSANYSFQIECNVAAASSGLRVKEVPIAFEERRFGKSKANAAEVARSASDVFRFFVVYRWRRLIQGSPASPTNHEARSAARRH